MPRPFVSKRSSTSLSTLCQPKENHEVGIAIPLESRASSGSSSSLVDSYKRNRLLRVHSPVFTSSVCSSYIQTITHTFSIFLPCHKSFRCTEGVKVCATNLGALLKAFILHPIEFLLDVGVEVRLEHLH